jgi:UTP--glucose-1-phosphate uridylyltransferase
MRGSDSVRKAVIPVGGLGTRLLPITKVLPKELLPVGRRPVIQYVVEEMRAARLEHICLVTGRKKTLIQEHFDHDPELVRHLQDHGRDDLLAELAYLESGLHLTYIRQSGPQGLADALSLAEDFVGDQSFVVALGDSIIREPQTGALLRKMIERHTASHAAATLAVEEVAGTKVAQYGIVHPTVPVDYNVEVFGIDDVIERPQPHQAPSNWAMAARYVFDPQIFPAIRGTRPAWGGETLLSDAIRSLLRQGGNVQAVRLSSAQQRHDIGNFGGYFRSFVDFALLDPYSRDEILAYLREACTREPGWEGDQ